MSTTSSALPQRPKPFGERPSPLISRRAVPLLFETVTSLSSSIENLPEPGERIYVLYASTRIHAISIFIHDGCLRLDLARRERLERSTPLALVPAFRLVHILDALVRANQHRTQRTTVSDGRWLSAVLRALAARGYVSTTASA